MFTSIDVSAFSYFKSMIFEALRVEILRGKFGDFFKLWNSKLFGKVFLHEDDLSTTKKYEYQW